MIEHRRQDHAAYWGQPNDVWTHDADAPCSHCEVERLREDNRWLREYQQRIEPQVEEWKAEVEWLRAELADVRRGWQEQTAIFAQERAEVERLRAKVER
jgi:chromosome segregation ATPase